MGNYSQDPQIALQNAVAKGYTRVRFQQGKPVLDREFNLAADLCGPERLAQAFIGNGTPAGSSGGFAISALNVAGNDFSIAAGSALVNGQEVVLAANTTYKTQPIQTHVANLPAGVSNIYLHVLLTEISSQQDPDLGNPGDVKAETAIRERLDWEVVVSATAVTTPDFYLLATIDTVGPVVTDQRRLGLTAAALRDELTAARGSAADLGTRLNASLAPSGALQPNSVSSTQVANGAVTIAKLVQSVVFNAQVSVPAATAAGSVGSVSLNLLLSDAPAFLLISVHFDGPRPSPAANVAFTQSFQWRCQSTLLKPAGATALQHAYGVLIENSSTTEAISVTCKAYQLTEA